MLKKSLRSLSPPSDDEVDETESCYKGLALSSGFEKVPSTIREGFYTKTAEHWLESVRETVNIGPYWRVHDKLYDLTDFVDSHPGGKFWLETTKGMDVTEAFQCSHINDLAEKTLQKYFIKDIDTPRFSPFTFEEDGFYMTLKRKAKVALKGVKNGPSTEMKFIHSALFVAFLSTLLYGCITSSITAVIIAGTMLTLSTNCSHNFFHQKDNWRMYIFDFSSLSSREWRTTHAISHHLFPNTVHDYEIFANQPHIELLPVPEKTFLQKYAFMPPNPFFLISFMVDYFRRVLHVVDGKKKFDYPIFIQPLLFLAILFTAETFGIGLLLWVVLQFTFNFTFLLIGWSAGHHSRYSFVEGDPALTDRDWGLHQIISIAERKETVDGLFLGAISFGNHTLHHMFPTLDHSKLHLLLQPLLETCEEFNVDFKIYSIWEVFLSVFYRFYNTKPNNLPIKSKFKKTKIFKKGQAI